MLTRRSVLALTGAAALGSTVVARAATTLPAFDVPGFGAAQAAEKPILVAVHAVWCGTCKAQAAVLKDLLPRDPFNKLAVFRVDFDDQKEAVKSFGARFQSTLVVFKGKTEVGRAVGITDPAEIEALLRKAV